MTSDEIRSLYLNFFKERGHYIIPSSSLVPKDDPTVLLTTAGMQQITPFFLGLEKPPAPRLTSCQKSFRTTDIDSVGDESHLTFFEMLGNFSVGDYFKPQIIPWAWELLTKGYRLPADKLWVTIYPDDDEAFEIWTKVAGVPAERITRLEGNFWGPVGDKGPCGPDSEIFLDRGDDKGCGRPECDPGCDCARFLEVWNLVFMQFFQDETGKRTPLPSKNIDTGLGLERMALIQQGCRSVYETDAFRPIVAVAEQLSGVAYGENAHRDASLRIIADHSRAATFLISDGVLPGNEGRGYILRRVLRRAMRHGRLLGIQGPFMLRTAAKVIEMMGPAYDNLVSRRDFIFNVIEHEETRFNQTLTIGLNLFESRVDDLERRGERLMPGELAFELYATHGFPVELTEELAHEHGLELDRPGFEQAMREHQAVSRVFETATLGAGLARDDAYEVMADVACRFVGYEDTAARAKVTGLLGEQGSLERAQAGDRVQVVLDQTPFYSESGGQTGDAGEIVGPNGRVRVNDTQRPRPNLVVHVGEVSEGGIAVGDEVRAVVDEERRLDTARNHTATHILQRALQRVLGDHVHQAGSLVTPERLRFDFTHLTNLTPDEIREVERLVNARIRENLPVQATETSYKEAIASGAMALFDEKYGDRVRLVTVGEWSRELCGGTHLLASGQVGLFLIVSEESVGSGLRRIEALTGRAAEEYAREQIAALHGIARQLRATPAEAPERLAALDKELQMLRRELGAAQRKGALSEAEELLVQAVDVNGAKVLTAKVDVANVDALREMGDWLRAKLGSSAVVLGAVMDGRPMLLAMLTPDIVKRGAHAGEVVKRAAREVGGGGGGKPDMAQAGGRDASRMPEALAAAQAALREMLA